MVAKKKWVQQVKTVSTYPPKDLFTKNAQTIARVMASKKVSPKGLGFGHPHDPVLHQPRWQEPGARAEKRTRESQAAPPGKNPETEMKDTPP